MNKNRLSLTLLVGRSVIINSRYRLTYCRKYIKRKVICTSMCDTYEGNQKCGKPCKILNKHHTFALLDIQNVTSKNLTPKIITIEEQSGDHYKIDDDVSIFVNDNDRNSTSGLPIVFKCSDNVVVNRECFEMATENNFYDRLKIISKNLIKERKNGE